MRSSKSMSSPPPFVATLSLGTLGRPGRSLLGILGRSGSPSSAGPGTRRGAGTGFAGGGAVERVIILFSPIIYYI